MPASPLPRLACRDCGGFPVVAITTGDHHRDGTRVTVRVTCPACRGTGHTTLVFTGRTGR